MNQTFPKQHVEKKSKYLVWARNKYLMFEVIVLFSLKTLGFISNCYIYRAAFVVIKYTRYLHAAFCMTLPYTEI